MARLTWGEGSVYEGDITISNGEKVPHGYGVYNNTKTGACYRGAFYYGHLLKSCQPLLNASLP